MLIIFWGNSPSTIERHQHHFRWRNDDGSESTATWKAAEDTDTNVDRGANVRLRVQVAHHETTIDPEQYKLQVQKVGDAVWDDVS